MFSAWCCRNRSRRRASSREAVEWTTQNTVNVRSNHKHKVSKKRPILHDVYLDRLFFNERSRTHHHKLSQSYWEFPTERKLSWRDLMVSVVFYEAKTRGLIVSCHLQPLTVSRAKRSKSRARSRSCSRTPQARYRHQQPDQPDPRFPVDVSPDNTEDPLSFQPPTETRTLFTNFPSPSMTNLREPKRMHVAVLISMPSAPPSLGGNRLPSMEIGCTHVPISPRKRRRDLSIGRFTTS